MSWITRSVIAVIAMMGSNTVVAETTFEQYSKSLKLLTISDPKPAVANIAGGFGAGQGLFYAAVSYSDYDLQTKDRDDDDGSIAFGLGLGDPVNSIGGEITIGLTSVSTSLWGDGKFADEGNVSGKVHKRVTPVFGGNAASVALGASNFAGWGSTKDNPVNYYGAYSEQKNFGSFKQYGLAYTLGTARLYLIPRRRETLSRVSRLVTTIIVFHSAKLGKKRTLRQHYTFHNFQVLE